MNSAGKAVQNLNAKKLSGKKLSDKEQKELKESTIQFRRYQKAVLGADASIGRFQRNVGNYPKQLNAVASAFRNISGALGFSGGLYLFIGLMKDAFATIKGFNSRILNVSKTTGLAGKSLDNLSIDIINLSKKLETVGTNALLDYATVAGQLGVKGSKNILQFTEALAKLETASDISGEEGGANIARLLTLTDGGVQNVKEFSDELVKLGNNFAATENEILGNAKAIAQNTGVYKLGRQEALAFAVATKAVGIESEITGSTIGKTLGIVEKAIRKGEGLEQISRLTGITQNELGKSFKENSGTVLTKLIKGLNSVEKSGGSVNEELEKLGIVSVRNQRVIGTLATAGFGTLEQAIYDVNDAVGSLDAEFETASGKIENQISRITNAWDNFVLGIEDGKGSLGGVIKFMADSAIRNFDRLNLILNENTSIWEKNRTGVNSFVSAMTFGFVKPFEESTNALIKNTEELNRNRKEIEEQNIAFVNQYGSLAPLVEEQSNYNDELQTYFSLVSGINKNEGFADDEKTKSISDLRIEIKALNDEIEQSAITDKEGIRTKQKEIEVIKKQIDTLLGVNNARENGVKILKGSIKAYKAVISKLEDQQSRLATNGAEWKVYETKIKKAKEELEEFNLIIEQAQIELNGLDLSGFKTDSFKDAAEKIKELLTQDNTIEGLDYDGPLDDIKNFFSKKEELRKRDFEKEKETAEMRKELESELQAELINFTNALFDGKIQRYDDDIQRNNDRYAQILDSENLTEEQRSALEAEREQKNAELEKKKRKEQRKQAVFNKVIALAEIAINTQIAASKAATAAPPPANIPLIALAISLGVAQAATVLATPIPQYKMGKGDYDNYEGAAIWGERKREVKISKNGNIEVSPKKIGNHLTHVKRDDVIHPDANRFFSDEGNNMYRGVYDNILGKNLYDLNFKTKDSSADIQTHTNEIVRAIARKKNKTVINQTINIGEDIKYAIKGNF